MLVLTGHCAHFYRPRFVFTKTLLIERHWDFLLQKAKEMLAFIQSSYVNG
jgi:hypothetical protein